jgi:leucyl/phenylalanyl-tRNA---protein transferase
MAVITAENVLYAYTQGIFPMADSESNEIFWYAPNPRAIIPLETYKPAKSLRPVLNKNTFEIRVNQDFKGVINNCAKPRSEFDGVWISPAIKKIYLKLHQMGYAHSVEAYLNQKLVGGLYGVSLGSVFFGESMFYKAPNASKVAFHFLIERLKSKNYLLLDTQFMNDNVKRFGAEDIPKDIFLRKLNQAIRIPNTFV